MAFDNFLFNYILCSLGSLGILIFIKILSECIIYENNTLDIYFIN